MGSISDLKSTVITQLLQHEDFILMLVQPAAPGVKLPEELMQSSTPVGINIGWRMSIPVPDLTLGDEGISGTLSFNRTPFFCEFPWHAIIQVTAGDEHLIWIEPSTAEQQTEDEPPQPAEPPRLKLV